LIWRRPQRHRAGVHPAGLDRLCGASSAATVVPEQEYHNLVALVSGEPLLDTEVHELTPTSWEHLGVCVNMREPVETTPADRSGAKMRIAALFDIHGNLPALEAVLADVRRAKADAIVVGGDLVPGPMPRDVLNALLECSLPLHFIHGNGESAALAEWRGRHSGVPEQFRDGLRWSAGQLFPDHERFIEGWPTTLRLALDMGDVLFCHATPRSDNEIFTVRTPESVLIPLFEPLAVGLVACGHTHMQFDRQIGSTRVVNAGSVGMPFGHPGAFWLLLSETCEFRCTDYDHRDAAARIEATSYPQATHFAKKFVLQCPSAAEMLAAFATAEMKA
jgi:predicted phosphodiesterase